MELLHFPREITAGEPGATPPLRCCSDSAPGAPPAHTPEWALQSAAILDEAAESTGRVSRRRWMVVHPQNARLLELAGDATSAISSQVERPRALRWLSSRDGKEYCLIEYLALRRQDGWPD